MHIQTGRHIAGQELGSMSYVSIIKLAHAFQRDFELSVAPGNYASVKKKELLKGDAHHNLYKGLTTSQ